MQSGDGPRASRENFKRRPANFAEWRSSSTSTPATPGRFDNARMSSWKSAASLTATRKWILKNAVKLRNVGGVKRSEEIEPTAKNRVRAS